MPTRILLIQLADIGDLILTTPALAALREAFPKAHVTLATSAGAAKVLEAGSVDELLLFDKRGLNGTLSFFRPANWRHWRKIQQGKYDTVIFFHHFTLKLGTLKFALLAKLSGAPHIVGLENGNGWFLTHKVPDQGFGAVHEAQYWLNLVGSLGASNQPRRAQVAFDNGVLPIAAYQGMRVVIHAGGGGYNLARRWSPQAFAQVADALVERYKAQIVLVGSPSDDAATVKSAMQNMVIDLSGKTTLTQLADVIRSADVYIGADSGILHLAAAVRTPVVAIYGASNYRAWSPWSPNGRVIILRSAPECSPCSYVGKQVGSREGCAARTCMRLVTPEQVIGAVSYVLDSTQAAAEPDDLNETGVESLIHLAQATVPPPKFDPPFDFATKPPAWKERARILDIPIDRITYADWMKLIDQWVKKGTRPHHVCTVNPEFMVIAQQDAIFRYILQRADLCLADGVGLLWAGRVLDMPFPERVTGSDGTVMIAEQAAERGWKLFLLGAAPGVAEQAAAVMREYLPAIQVVGTYAGSPAAEEEDAIVARVNDSGADVLLVAYGAPKQDKWIARNLPRLQVKMAMGVGGALDFIAGVIPRAPEWMQKYGLEWLYRLYKQPWRIVRMLRLPYFVLLVLLRGEK